MFRRPAPEPLLTKEEVNGMVVLVMEIHDNTSQALALLEGDDDDGEEEEED